MSYIYCIREFIGDTAALMMNVLQLCVKARLILKQKLHSLCSHRQIVPHWKSNLSQLNYVTIKRATFSSATIAIATVKAIVKNAAGQRHSFKLLVIQFDCESVFQFVTSESELLPRITLNVLTIHWHWTWTWQH